MNAKDVEKNAEKFFAELGDGIPTVSGLALAIGFKSRYELLNFEGNTKLSKAVKSALLKLESILESQLYRKETYSGAKTVLKSNFGWRESVDDDDKFKAINRVKEILEGVGD